MPVAAARKLSVSNTAVYVRCACKTRTQLLFFPPRSRNAEAVVRLPRAVIQLVVGVVRGRLVYGFRLPAERHATDSEPSCQSCLQHTHARAPSRHHRHGLRIINVAMQCTNHCRATGAKQVPARPPAPTAVQMTASNCAPRLFAACMSNARLAS